MRLAHWFPAYVGLGSNLDDPPRQLQRAVAALEALEHNATVRLSPLYGSRPMGPVAQADFCNAVAGVLTRLPAEDFFHTLRELERELGRATSVVRWGPRRIDLDLLAHGQSQFDTEPLKLPHPGIAARNFVLYPWADIAPELHLPGLGRVAELVRVHGTEGLWKL